MKPQKFRTVDVRTILAEGAEPFPILRASVEALPAGEGLTVISPFLPSPLIERLGAEGFQSRVERGGHGCWITQFWREA